MNARRAVTGTILAIACVAAFARTVRAGDAAPLEPLNPELAAHPYAVAPGVRPYAARFAVSPAWGTFGSGRIYLLRAAYAPTPWLGYEGSLGHNPGSAAHAVLHSFQALVRRPLPGRFQPYASAGYGMLIVYPSQSVNAKPVTKNALTAGGGLEFFIRNDLAIRGEYRRATVFGRQRDRNGVVAYEYPQGTIGLAFYRSVQP